MQYYKVRACTCMLYWAHIIYEYLHSILSLLHYNIILVLAWVHGTYMACNIHIHVIVHSALGCEAPSSFGAIYCIINIDPSHLCY